ncbi:MAG: bifunctional aldolase/short-chain dehydrogenase [Desulfosarcina sp.]|nr:bifunctional aldolase/short-chain dehydrogenase [Desulfobacterales bacterium]
MENFFNIEQSRSFISNFPEHHEDLALRVYTSRLLGSNKNLVLHGGGNTSVKINMPDITGESKDVIFIKGSGADLEFVDPESFTGLDLEPLRKLSLLEKMTEEEMDNQLRIHRIWADSPDPSVETVVHAFLPHKYIDHTHADAILVLTNSLNGQEILNKALGANIAVIPYIMSGFPLAKAILNAYEKNPAIEAVVVMNHGIFTFSDDAETAYNRMIESVTRAEAFIMKQMGDKPVMGFSDVMPATQAKNSETTLAGLVQALRGACAYDGGGVGDVTKRFYVEIRNNAQMVGASCSKEAEFLCRTGVLTPDHVIRTKNRMVYIESIPEKDDDLKIYIDNLIASYKKDYHEYFIIQSKTKGVKRKELDSLPRLFLAAGFGLIALGYTKTDAVIAADIGEQTIKAKLYGKAIGDYLPISDSHIFDMEYWPLQLKKLKKRLPSLLEGQVAMVTGAGGAIGFGIAKQLLKAGAAVVLSDINKQRLLKVRSILSEEFNSNRIEIQVFDVTNYDSVKKALVEMSLKFGGIDILVPNAGIACVATIEDLDPDKFDQVIAVNLKGTFNVIKAAIPVFKRQNTGGNIVVISSKNVFDPGAAFGAYSASKAGAHQISKIAAMELAPIGVKVNMINPDAVFGDAAVSSQLWDLIGPDRMKSRGLDAEGLKDYYKNRNLLKQSVTAEHVGNAELMPPSTGKEATVVGV